MRLENPWISSSLGSWNQSSNNTTGMTEWKERRWGVGMDWMTSKIPSGSASYEYTCQINIFSLHDILQAHLEVSGALEILSLLLRCRCWDCIGFNSKKRLGLLLFSFVEMIATDPRRIRGHRCATQVHTWILAREASKHHRNGRKTNRKQRMQGTASASTSLPRNRELLFPGVTESSCWQMCFFLFFFFFP